METGAENSQTSIWWPEPVGGAGHNASSSCFAVKFAFFLSASTIQGGNNEQRTHGVTHLTVVIEEEVTIWPCISRHIVEIPARNDSKTGGNKIAEAMEQNFLFQTSWQYFPPSDRDWEESRKTKSLSSGFAVFD